MSWGEGGAVAGSVIPGIDVHPITDETLSDATVIDTLVCILLWI